MRCEYCNEDEADFLSKIDEKWYHIDCYFELKTNPLGVKNLAILTCINCGAVLIIAYFLYYILYWMNQP